MPQLEEIIEEQPKGSSVNDEKLIDGEGEKGTPTKSEGCTESGIKSATTSTESTDPANVVASLRFLHFWFF